MRRPPVLRMPPRGFSLIELLVSMALGLIVVLAITGVLVRSEGSKRTMTTVNDISQTGAYLSYVIDRQLRSAGSGYIQRWRDVFGCAINVKRGGATVLPRGSAMPLPFAATPQAVRMAPVVIGKNQSAAGSDVLTVLTGSAGFAESPMRVPPGSVSTSGLRLPNTLGARGGDLVLLAEDGVGCMLQQVGSPFTGSDDQDLPLAGTYYTTTGSGVALASFGVSANSFAIPLGDAADNGPQFQLLGVGADSTLFGYDLLQLDGSDTPVPIADGVTALRALYGVDTNNDGRLDGWVDPGTSPYTEADLRNGSAASQTNLRRIVAVRVALVLRSPLVEKDDVSPETLTLFSDQVMPMKQSIALSGDDRKRRFRVVDFTVPLRNARELKAAAPASPARRPRRCGLMR